MVNPSRAAKASSSSSNGKEGETNKKKTPMFLDVSSLSVKELQNLRAIPNLDERRAKIMDICVPTKDADGKPLLTTKQIRSIVKMSFWEELAAFCLFAFGVPGAVVTMPAIFIGLGFALKSAKLALLCAGIFFTPLMIFPVKFYEDSLTSWPAIQILKYFSCKIIFEEQIKPNKPTILVAPPHGVFPFGKFAHDRMSTSLW
jgi:hypothetical protein